MGTRNCVWATTWSLWIFEIQHLCKQIIRYDYPAPICSLQQWIDHAVSKAFGEQSSIYWLCNFRNCDGEEVIWLLIKPNWTRYCNYSWFFIQRFANLKRAPLKFDKNWHWGRRMQRNFRDAEFNWKELKGSDTDNGVELRICQEEAQLLRQCHEVTGVHL